MLFQTFYSINPYDHFEPPLTACTNAVIDDAGRACTLQIVLRHPSNEDDPSPSTLFILLTRRVAVVPETVLGILQGTNNTFEPRSSKRVDGFQDYPAEYRDFLNCLVKDMDAQATDILNVTRWRLGIRGGPLVLSSDVSTIRWHDDASDRDIDRLSPFLNSQIPMGVSELYFPECQTIHISSTDRAEVQALLRSETIQPLHHDLFREAWQNQRQHPRSSLVLCMAALETAVKSTLCDLNDSVRWILENIPSPPIDRFLRDYLPSISARNTFNGIVKPPPLALLTVVRRGIELRNRLVHGREDSISHSDLEAVLLAVWDIAYLLDFYRGHDWALQLLRRDTLRALMDSCD